MERDLPTLFSRNGDVVARHVAGECLLVPAAGTLAGLGRIFALNPMGETVWDLLGEEMTLDTLARRIVERFDVDPSTAERDLTDFLEEMEREGLISRREAGDTAGR